MLKSENDRKKRLWALKPFESDVLCSDVIRSSVAGPPKKQRQAYTPFTFCIMSALHPTVRYICIKLLPGTSAFSESKQPPLLFTLNEPSPPPLRPSILFPSHTQSWLAYSTRVSSLFCTWLVLEHQQLELLLAAIALGLHTSVLVLMSVQHKHKHLREDV